MSSFKFVFVICVAVLAMSLRNVRALSSKEKQRIHAATYPPVVECSAEVGVPMDDIDKAYKSDTMSTLDPCLMACFFKKVEMIDEKGLYDVDKAKEFTKEFFSDKDVQKKGNEIISNCKSVNDQEVTDDEKGCERAALLVECFRPYQHLFED